MQANNWPNWEMMHLMTRDEQIEELLNRNIIYEDDEGKLRWTEGNDELAS